MEEPSDRKQNGVPAAVLSNADIADRLAGLAQLLSTQKENPYKVKAYHRAAARIRNLPESFDEMVRREEDLTQFSGIGAAIASAIREIVTTGTLSKLERLRGDATPAVAELTAHPRLNPKRVMRVYKNFDFSSLDELRALKLAVSLPFAPHYTENHAILPSAAFSQFTLSESEVASAGGLRSPCLSRRYSIIARTIAIAIAVPPIGTAWWEGARPNAGLC